MSVEGPGATMWGAGGEIVEVASGRRVLWDDVERQARQLTRTLVSRGIGPGGAVGLMMDNRAEYLVVLRAMYMAGFDLVSVSWHLSEHEIADILNDASAAALITFAEVSPGQLDGIVGAVDAIRGTVLVVGAGESTAPGTEDFATALGIASDEPLDAETAGQMIRYTSGTTGRPRGIVIRDVPTGAGASRDFARHTALLLSMDESTRLLLTAPLYHAGPSLLMAGARSVGGSIVLMDHFDAATTLAVMEQERITHSYWVPTMFHRMLRLDPAERVAHDLSAHRVALHVGAPCPRQVKAEMMAWWGPIIHEFYGGSEGVGMTWAGPHDWLAHPGTVGRPIGCTIHICDEGGFELPAGEIGIIYLDTGSIGFDYKDDPEKLRNALHPSQPTWVTIGDIGYVDDDGFLFLTDRRADVIVSGGVNIYSRQVEEVLLQHPAVLDAVVLGLADTEYGETVGALVEVDGAVADQALADELSSLVADRLARFKRPRLVAFTNTVPRQPTGKIRKQDVVVAMNDAVTNGRSFVPHNESVSADG